MRRLAVLEWRGVVWSSSREAIAITTCLLCAPPLHVVAVKVVLVYFVAPLLVGMRLSKIEAKRKYNAHKTENAGRKSQATQAGETHLACDMTQNATVEFGTLYVHLLKW